MTLIVQLKGGLGNQMYQYAFGLRIATQRQETLTLDASSLESDTLRNLAITALQIDERTTITKRGLLANPFYLALCREISFRFGLLDSMYFERDPFVYEARSVGSKAHYYSGYWQSRFYFESIRLLLLEHFVPSTPLSTQSLSALGKISSCNSVSIHVRRGDYAFNAKTNKAHGTCGIEYYKRAIDLLKGRLLNPRYFVFSDDIPWCRENLQIPNEPTFVDFNSDSPEQDIFLMKNCRHHVIANSSFSWWGAWLSDFEESYVIAPRNWMLGEGISDGLKVDGWIVI